MRFGFIGRDDGDGKSDSGTTDDIGFRCDDVLPRRKRDPDLIFSDRKPLVNRRNDTVDHGNTSRNLFGFGNEFRLYFCGFGQHERNGDAIACHTYDHGFGRNDFLPRRKCYADVFNKHRKPLV